MLIEGVVPKIVMIEASFSLFITNIIALLLQCYLFEIPFQRILFVCVVVCEFESKVLFQMEKFQKYFAMKNLQYFPKYDCILYKKVRCTWGPFIMVLILNMHFLFQAKGLYVAHSVLGVSCLWIASLDK